MQNVGYEAEADEKAQYRRNPRPQQKVAPTQPTILDSTKPLVISEAH